MSLRIYLDFNASTPICPEAVEAMRPVPADHYGNPSSLHWAGMQAKDAVEKARGQPDRVELLPFGVTHEPCARTDHPME